MNTKFPSKLLDKLSEAPLSPRSPRNKIQRKPDNLRTRYIEEKCKRQTSKGCEFNGFYSPKRVREEAHREYLKEPAGFSPNKITTLTNHRSLSHFSKPDFAYPHGTQNQSRNKENSASASSGKSSNDRQRSRAQLQLKALGYQNTRLKSEKKSLQDQNKYLKNQLSKLSEQLGRRIREIALTPRMICQNRVEVEKLNQRIVDLQIQLKEWRLKGIQNELLVQSKLYSESLIKTLESINKDQKEQLGEQERVTKYMEIELRTLKKQKADWVNNKMTRYQFDTLEGDNRRLRSMVSDLQNRLKSSLLFDLTPQPSQNSESFLLD